MNHTHRQYDHHHHHTIGTAEDLLRANGAATHEDATQLLPDIEASYGQLTCCERAAVLARFAVRDAITAGHVGEVVIYCDRCARKHRAHYTGETYQIRLASARTALAAAGWDISPEHDLCPNCAGQAGS